jgi:diguanylate cyclase (GGDEF)-like protein
MNHGLLAQIKGDPQLPSLPAVAVQVLELAKQSNATAAGVAKVISSDPALVAKVLKTVNSSFYGLSHQVSTINHAIVLLGMQTVKTLALGFSLASSLNSKKSAKFDYVRFWRQSLFSAVAARTLAKVVQSKEPEEAFLAGLLSDIGTLAMHRALGREYDILLEKSEGDQVKLLSLSREKFDLDHAQVGGALAEHWKFPPQMVEPIRQHHSLADRGAQAQGLVEIVHAGVLCGQVYAAKRKGLLQAAKKELTTRFKLDEARIKAIFKEIHSQTNELADLFDVKIEPGRSFMEVEQEAREALTEISLQTQFQNKQMECRNQELNTLANTDSLTGLANRNHFNECIALSLSESSVSRKPLSLLFLDLDHFKTINDTHGHQAGDEVLARVGKLIKSLSDGNNLAARYGGEEFAVILSDKDSAAAGKLAELIRKSIQSEKITFEDKTISVTVSVGIATADAQNHFGSLDEMVRDADQALYAAKKAGRNCVRASSGTSSHGARRGAA